MATRGVTGPGTADDGSLQTAAIGGDGHAFAELYDRHERRVYGFCLRMLGTPHDAADATQETFLRMLQRLPALEGRELNFAAYALKVARNACYDALDVRKRVEPVSDHDELPLGPVPIDDDPERAAMLSATREQVQAANASLPPAQREVLALREVESLSYAQIGEIIGLKENAVAQLISRARIGLRNAVRGSALSSVGASSADCARAIPLLAAVQDGQDAELEELSFLHAHLATCDTCRLRREAMEEAGVSYRALAPIVVVEWLRHATIARAAELVGADWSDVAGEAPAGQAAAPADHAARRGQWRRHAGTVLGGGVLCVLAVLGLASTLSTDRLPTVTMAASNAAVHHAAHRRSGPALDKRHAARRVTAHRVIAATSAPPRSTTSSAPLGADSGTQPTRAAGHPRRGGHRHVGGTHHGATGGLTLTGDRPTPTPTTTTPTTTTPPPTTPSTTTPPPTTPTTTTTTTITTTTTTTTTTPGGPPTFAP
jgi:RNA polymerase sigma factor (sigma-70 family)